jgi:TonB family protein
MSFVLDVFAKTSVILLVAVGLSMALRRSSASLRHAVWIASLAGAVLLPIAAALVPQLEWSALPQTATSVTFLPMDNGLSSTAPHTLPKPDAANPPLTSSLAIAFVWMSGAVLLLFRFGAGVVAVRGMAKKAAGVDEEGWLTLIEELRSDVGIRRRVNVFFSQLPASPMTWGVLRPTVLLPATAHEWSKERRRVVLAHELAHVKRNDALAQIFVQLVCGIYWLNPLVWCAAHRIRIERERACDDRVLRLGTTASDYADHLIQILRGLRSQRTFSLAAISMAQPSQLETRLVSILDSRASRRTLSKTGLALLGSITAVITISLSAIGIAASAPLPPVAFASIRVTPAPPAQPATKPPTRSQRTRIGNGDVVPSSAVIPPRVVESKPPIYTDEATLARIEGTVTLEAAVDVRGAIKILRVVKALGYGLDERAIGAALDWKFEPGTRNGVPVETIMQLDVDFKLPPPKIDSKDGSEVLKVGRGVSPPTVISRVEPAYSDEARDAKYQGTVVVRATVHKDGTLTVDKVVRELGLGLDQKAIEALEMWKFKPATRNGEPVAVELNIEVNFNLK